MKLTEELKKKIDDYFNSPECEKNMNEYFDNLNAEENERKRYFKSNEFDEDIEKLKIILKEHGGLSYNDEYDWERMVENGIDRKFVEKVEDCVFNHPNFLNEEPDEENYHYFMPENYIVYKGVVFEMFFGQGTLIKIYLKE